ncbi:MAG: hypothetical protein RIR70_1447 [Pseudomonadota bacterium]|jgi:serine protease DegS/serine protease DegQ
MRRLWLIFSQAVTVTLAVVFVVSTLKPEWLPAPASGAPPQVAGSETSSEPSPREAGAVSYAQAARRAVPAVVHIYTSKAVRAPRSPWAEDPIFKYFFGERFNERPQRAAGLGSGVIVSAEGFILTNNHVIEAADEIEVALNDSRKFKARVVGRDPDSDLAVLKIASPGKLPAISFASPGSLKVGDVVLAIGNPFGVGQTTTMGIVSALDRTQLGINTFEDFIQTDAAINPGNSGGALVDTQGKLVGINTAIYTRTGGSAGIGFAIPVSLARDVMEQIIQNGSVTRGWVGVEMQELTPELVAAFNLPDTQGALVAGVIRNGPADRAGMRPGDIIVAVADRKVSTQRDVIENIARQKPGTGSRLKIRRGNDVIELDIEVGKRPTPKIAQD